MALGTAFRAFFAALTDASASKRIQAALDGDSEAATPGLPQPTAIPKEPVPVVAPKPRRSEAITLLASLQREARFVDLVKENLAQYSDAQIGAAARPCLQQCASTLERFFGLTSIESAADGTEVSVPQSATSLRYQWIGEGTSVTGKLVHHGWQATRAELPQWTGSDEDSLVVAPVQVQRL